MSENKKILLRDNLQDTGAIPSQTGYYYSSPDLIVHEQLADPKTFFKNNYDKDVNQPLKTGSMTNTIYTRVKNLDATPSQGYIRVYAANSSLFMTPSKWSKNILKVSDGQEFAETGIIQPNEIGVPNKPFIFNATKERTFCHVGYVTTSFEEVPVIPPDFTSYDLFVKWIKENPHIALRNFSCVSSEKSDYERIDDLSNPSDTEDRLAAFTITLNGTFPVGTKVMADFSEIEIHSEHTVSKLSPKTIFTDSGMVPAGFKGDLITKLKLPGGNKWPVGGSVHVSAYINISENSIALPYVVNLLREPALAVLNVGKLVHIGTCSTLFIKPE